MAIDSIIARPTNRVRVMVAEASGCCASALSAVATERPSPSAGAMHPTPVVMPAVTIEATAMTVMLSIMVPLVGFVAVSCLSRRLRFGLAGARGCCDVDRGQDTEDIR